MDAEKQSFLRTNSDGRFVDSPTRTWRSLFSIRQFLDDKKHQACKAICKGCFEPVPQKPRPPAQEVFALTTHGDVEGLERLLSEFPELLDLKNDSGKTLMHLAAEHGHAQLIDMLFGKGCDSIYKPDNEGNTPLHIAAMHNHIQAVKTLIAIWRSVGQGKVGFCKRNEALETPMHLAVRHGSAASLECLLSTCNGGVNTPGWHGETPLHVASCYNDVDCARILIKCGADPLKASFSGMKPVHNAAQKASRDILEYLLTNSGTPKEDLLALVDDEVQTPLHWAVNNGDPEAVQILLKHGANLAAKMYDQSTPLHLACSQGLIRVVETMFQMVPGDFLTIMEQKDTQGMTCLHRATMFNHACCVRFLLAKNVLINEEDCEGRTPLVLAASRASWECGAELFRVGADPDRIDHCGRNFLHYVISHGKAPDCVDFLNYPNMPPRLLDQKDIFGCTPLHYAAQNGSLKSSAGLLRLGASIAAKNKHSQSPLHFAARYGRFNTVKRLLDTDHGFNLINDSDKDGMTALHLAAENGHSRVVQLLMSKGALIHRDCTGRTPLHLAAASNFREQTKANVCWEKVKPSLTSRLRLALSEAGRIALGLEEIQETVDVIAVHYAHLVDSADKEGNTALHLAAANNSCAVVVYLLSAGAALTMNNLKQLPIDIIVQKKHAESANAMVFHDRWEEILTRPSAVYTCPVLGLVEHLPDVMSSALDRCIVRAPCHPLSKNYFIHFDYKLLEPDCTLVTDATEHAHLDTKEPLTALNAMVRHGRTELLSHAVCSSYLNKKWASYGVYFHGMHVTIYAIFLGLLTYLVCAGVQNSLVPILKTESIENYQKHTHETYFDDNSTLQAVKWFTWDKPTSSYSWVVIVVSCFTIGNMMKEVCQMVHQKRKYFGQLVNYLEWILYITATIFALGYYDASGTVINWKTRWQLGACAIFFAWFNLMLYLQRFGLMGIYVVMFLGILKTLLRALFVFVFLIVAFGLAFHVLLPLSIFPDNAGFYQGHAKLDLASLRTPHLGLLSSSLRITGMMLGDLDAINNYIHPITDNTLPFPEMTYVFLVMFVVVVSILLMNLLIGLAVGDIENIQRSAMLRRMGMQVELHTVLERKFPKWFRIFVGVHDDKYYPNRSTGILRKIWFITTDPAKAMKEQPYEVTHAMQPGKVKTELQKQNSKMKDLQKKIDQQHDLLRLIVQKMEINDEADELDEGVQAKGPRGRTVTSSAMKRVKWASGAVQAKAKSVAAFSHLSHKT